MLLDHPISPVSEEKRAVGENYTRRRFEILCRVLCNSLEESHSMECRSYCEIDEHDRVAGVFMSTPCTIPSQLLERGRNTVWISFNVEPNCLQDSGNDIAEISSHDISAGVC